MLAVNDVQTITIAIVAFLVIMVVGALVRILLNRQDPAWRRIRIGFFVERDRTEKPTEDTYERGDL